MDLENEEPVHLDAVLERLGSFKRHQVITLVMISLIYATNSMYNVNYVFAIEDVNYRCKIPNCDYTNLSTPWLNSSDLDDNIKQCHLPIDRSSCGYDITDGDSELECTEWVYENEHTFVTEMNLGCQEWKQTLIGTIHSFGNMLGLLVQGQISDRFGRKTAAVFAGTVGAVLGITKSYATSYWFYVVLECLEAAAGDALSPIFMLSIEIVPKKHTVVFQMILLNCYTVGLILMSFIAWAVPYWRYFLRIIYAPSLIIITYSFFLDESIRWLFSKGKRSEGIKLIQKIAKRNNVEIDKRILVKLDYVDEEPKEFSDMKLLMKTFKSKIMMQRFLVCLVWWFTITLINYGMMISSVLIDGNRYVNFALLMLMDIPANIFYWVALSKYKRKMPLIASFVVGGLFCVSNPFIPNGYAWIRTTLFMLFEMLATFSYNIVYMYTSELFPTYTRNSMHALCSAVGRVGSLLAPQTPLLMSYWSGMPSLIFGLTSLVSGVLALSTPETANLELPDTVLQAERLGKEDREELKTDEEEKLQEKT